MVKAVREIEEEEMKEEANLAAGRETEIEKGNVNNLSVNVYNSFVLL